jgi:hypothetical protein
MLKPGGKYLILSGNHRVKAARKAGLKYVLLLYVENITHEKQLAYQLSHNSLVGKDDANILSEIYREIQNLDIKAFSGLNDLDFIRLDDISLPSVNEKDITFVDVKYLFVQSKADDIEKVISELSKLAVDDDTKLVFGCYEEYISQLSAIKKYCNIKSNTIAFIRMIEICREYLSKTEPKKN